jgi:hypothetical protein
VLRFACEDLPVDLLIAALRVPLRVAAAEPVLLVLERRLEADFVLALRPVVAADRLPPAERFAFPRLVIVLPQLAAAFFVVERFLRLRGFSVPPVTASAMPVAALDTPSMAASMLVLAASTIVARTDVPCPAFSSSMLYTSLSVSASERHTESRQGSIEWREKAMQGRVNFDRFGTLPPPPCYLATQRKLEDGYGTGNSTPRQTAHIE